MSPLIFALVDAWLKETMDASRQMWCMAAESGCSGRLRRELNAHLAAAEERLGWWRSTWVSR